MKKSEHPPLPCKTVDQAVAHLKSCLPQKELDLIANCETEFKMVGLCHHGLGTWIRNSMGLWKGNPELLANCLEAFEKKRGFATSHPDDASGVILRRLWEDLRERPMKTIKGES